MENKTVEKLVEENKNNMVTTTQLRQLLSNSVIVKNKISSNVLKKEDKLSDKLLNDVKYLLIKHTYQCGREFKVKEFDKKLKGLGIKGTTFKKLVSTGLLENIIVKDDKAVIQKDKQGNIVIDTELRDTELIPLTFPGGIEEFIKEEVLPYHEDAFVDKSKTQIGYEINFTKYFYKPKQLESVESIVAKIRELEKQSEGLMKEILEGLND